MDDRLRRALHAAPHRTSRLRRGYAVAEVDDFLERVRRGCAGPAPQVAPQHVRSAGFRFALGGYDISATDAVLAGIEDALAAQAAGRALAGPRRQVWSEQVSAVMAAVRGRLAGPGGDRFPRGRWLERTYDRSDVDQLCRLVADHLAGRGRLRPADVRSALFRPRRGRRGYREVPVDAFFDRVVELIAALDEAARTRGG
ncbi:DivIVA domain-containing protein [Kineococcus xinjiangensis]|uniref:DivIVA domain-containing protein n=1 Tax=Kineococcus xinjiangensis TaxID=512762 RepID=A0A2S6IVY6_9ACTN|nr:DivIVA domain-containing protein [Kineococcus xinjiangensis]PPK98508.1 DivIVA domain-containing protein [Kineococcus xinjiangensis]